MAIDVVYIVMRNSEDWSGPPPVFVGIGKSVEEALLMAYNTDNPGYTEDWMQEKSGESRAYESVYAYDMTTSPPTKMDRPDLKRGGGPVNGT